MGLVNKLEPVNKIEYEINQLSDLRYEYINKQEDSWNEQKMDYDYNPPEIDELGNEILEHIKNKRDDLRVDFILFELTKLGQAPSLVYDDNGHFAVTSAGVQSVPSGNDPEALSMTVFIEKEDWKNTPREALYHYLYS